MRIDITHIHSTTSSPLIDFTTVYGTGRATWAGKMPKLYETYAVKFDIPEIPAWGETITVAEEASIHISYEAGILHLTGLLEQIDLQTNFLCYDRANQYARKRNTKDLCQPMIHCSLISMAR